LSNVLKTSSNSTGCGVACAFGIVAPGLKPCSDSPGVISTYLSPSAERDRTISVESDGSSSTFFWSFIRIRALVLPFSCRSGVISLMTPIRKPPTRTSLPSTRFAAFGRSALTS
jgi:hypothetical protein